MSKRQGIFFSFGAQVKFELLKLRKAKLSYVKVGLIWLCHVKLEQVKLSYNMISYAENISVEDASAHF